MHNILITNNRTMLDGKGLFLTFGLNVESGNVVARLFRSTLAHHF